MWLGFLFISCEQRLRIEPQIGAVASQKCTIIHASGQILVLSFFEALEMPQADPRILRDALQCDIPLETGGF